MKTATELLVARLRRHSTDEVKSAIKEWATTDFHRRRRALDIMLEAGWEVVDVGNDAAVLPDGRTISRDAGVPMALRMDIHQRRLGEAFASTVTEQNEESLPGEALTSVLCPACKSSMAKSPICPNCSKGKAGFKVLCVCIECGHEVYL